MKPLSYTYAIRKVLPNALFELMGIGMSGADGLDT